MKSLSGSAAASVVVVVLMVATPLRAAPPPPASAPPPAPTSRPSPEQLHMQAYQFMLAGQLQRAHAPLEQAYKARPPAQQPRALVLNRAILDITQKVNIMRPVKDLREYLANLPPGQVDEDAVDLLGAALQAAAKNPKSPELPLYKSGEKQLHNSIELLEQARPHERKWGQKWYREIDFQQIQFSVTRATQGYEFEQGQADRLMVALEAARADAARYNTLNTSVGHRHANPTDAYYCSVCRHNRLLAQQAEDARAKVVTAEADYKVQKLKADKAKKEIPQPDWAAVPFRPFDPAGKAQPGGAAEPEVMPLPAPQRRPVESQPPPPPPSGSLVSDPAPTTLPSSP